MKYALGSFASQTAARTTFELFIWYRFWMRLFIWYRFWMRLFIWYRFWMRLFKPTAWILQNSNWSIDMCRNYIAVILHFHHTGKVIHFYQEGQYVNVL
jgi:hypothetical protein